ncbi:MULTISPECIES: hypothetical protein [Corynebacterium]|uniref:hypothetical protein n=1 Tax=Corynebacterium TaxID=1716 RepID=UPI0022B533B6|nr:MULTISPECIES: hypothetical protein [Corynebacterium]MCG7290911.1 hypothetical protein [Corynebacterium afermentans]MDC7108697.1 hypothetical protein [Corynebacterium afermentans]
MQAFFSWFTSQSGVSLLVALIALGGVLINNRAAEKRRRADQAAADQRRKDDQAAEDTRRKADDDRRERERQDALLREDYARQRKAVADCLRSIRESEARADGGTRDKLFSDLPRYQKQSKARNELDLEGVSLRENFYVECLTAVRILELEVTQPALCESIARLTSTLGSEIQTLNEKRDKDWNEYVLLIRRSCALTTGMQTRLNDLIDTAKDNLHVPISLKSELV